VTTRQVRPATGPRLGWLLAWLALSVALVAAIRATPWARASEVLLRQDARWAALSVALNLSILPLWAAEWVRLAPAAERPDWRRTLGVVALTSATLNTIPFFAGEATAVVLLVAHAGLSRAGALALLALDQLLVGVAKLAMIAAAALLAPLPVWLRGGVAALAAAVVVAGAALFTIARRRRSAAPSDRLGWLERWAARLDALRHPRRLAAVVALALLKKGAEVAAVIAAQRAVGIELPWWSAVLLVAALGVGTLVPVAPGNLGTYEASAFVVYRSLGVPAHEALGLAIVQHLYFLVPAVGTGYLLLTVRQLRPRAEAREVPLAASEAATRS
jgi:uncharacterized membrane protein YbhN (UPF0104 family)